MSGQALDGIPTERRRSLAVVLLALALASAAGAQAHKSAPSVVAETRANRAFAPVYDRYVHAVQTHGTAGLKQVALPNLVMRWAEGGRRTGANAYRELGRIYSGAKGPTISDKVWRLRVNGSTATAMVEESITMRSSNDFSATLTWDWKHTWRKTPEGWKLARIERTDAGPDKARPAVSFTVTAGEAK